MKPLKFQKYPRVLKYEKIDYHECSHCHQHYCEGDMDMEDGEWMCNKCESEEDN